MSDPNGKSPKVNAHWGHILLLDVCFHAVKPLMPLFHAVCRQNKSNDRLVPQPLGVDMVSVENSGSATEFLSLGILHSVSNHCN